jgi:hypothetical protein
MSVKQKREIVIKEVTSSHGKSITMDQQLRYISETEARNLSTLNLGCHILVLLHHLSSSSNNLYELWTINYNTKTIEQLWLVKWSWVKHVMLARFSFSKQSNRA